MPMSADLRIFDDLRRSTRILDAGNKQLTANAAFLLDLGKRR
jgi:hypothetical protein